MQKQIDIVSVDVQANRDAMVTLRLRLYPDGGNIETDCIFDISETSIVKGQVEGHTVLQLLARARDKIVAEFQQEIDLFVLEQTLTSMINTTQIANAIDITGVS